jgi:integrase/recombinase XerD
MDAMSVSTHIECRDRALIAFAIATGARDRAIISAKIKHVNLDSGRSRRARSGH